jgi:hypothetical protein
MESAVSSVREYAPTWFEIQHQAHQPSGVLATSIDTDQLVEQLGNSIDTRLVEIGDADTREAIQADWEARAAVAEFEQHSAQVSRLVAGTTSNPLEAAVAAHLAGQAAGAGLDAE